MTIKTFRGLIPDNDIDTIVLHTNDGSVGYRIVKFQAFSTTPGSVEVANVLKIYSTPQTTVDGAVDFNDQTLLAAIDFRQNDNEAYGITGETIVFDHMIFNQDIYVTNTSSGGGAAPLNYYIELEQVKLALDENTVATLKDIRNTARIPTT